MDPCQVRSGRHQTRVEEEVARSELGLLSLIALIQNFVTVKSVQILSPDSSVDRAPV